MRSPPIGLLGLEPALHDTTRLPTLARHSRAGRREIAALLLTGAAGAAVTTFADFRLGLPGHHILFAVFPMALGLALVPRRLAGSVMGASGVATLAALGAAGAHLPGPGALAGFALMGPLLDLALSRGWTGWRLYGAFLAAGAVTNTLAFIVRATTKYFGLGGLGGGRSFAAWLPVAVWTYALAGLLAGLLSAVVWFRLRPRE